MKTPTPEEQRWGSGWMSDGFMQECGAVSDL